MADLTARAADEYLKRCHTPTATDMADLTARAADE